MSVAKRKEIIFAQKNLSINRKCQLLAVAKSTLYYERMPESEWNLYLMRLLDEEFLLHPFHGSRGLRNWLETKNIFVSRKKVRRLMKVMGIRSIAPQPKTSLPNKQHKIYPYLLRDLNITSPNQVWAADITYIPMPKGFVYLVAVMDWRTRKILSWRVSNTLDTGFCVEALEEAIRNYGKPDIFNTDQGSQFTSGDFTSVLQQHKIKISMDGKGRWVDNVFIERVWRSLKYEKIYLGAYETPKEVREAVKEYFTYYNTERCHSSLDRATPDAVYYEMLGQAA